MFVYISVLLSMGAGAEGEISQNLGNICFGELLEAEIELHSARLRILDVVYVLYPSKHLTHWAQCSGGLKHHSALNRANLPLWFGVC